METNKLSGLELKLYHFRQNNSGGVMDVNDKVSESVWVQATSCEEANCIAEDIGIYFEGCLDGIDCECCGDRWNRVWDGDILNEGQFNKYTDPKGYYRNDLILVYLYQEKHPIKLNDDDDENNAKKVSLIRSLIKF